MDEIEQLRQSIHDNACLIDEKCKEVRHLREDIKEKEDRIEWIENNQLFSKSQ